jgi:hypothetical protein
MTLSYCRMVQWSSYQPADLFTSRGHWGQRTYFDHIVALAARLVYPVWDYAAQRRIIEQMTILL